MVREIVQQSQPIPTALEALEAQNLRRFATYVRSRQSRQSILQDGLDERSWRDQEIRCLIMLAVYASPTWQCCML
jgi:hypothetical protein